MPFSEWDWWGRGCLECRVLVDAVEGVGVGTDGSVKER